MINSDGKLFVTQNEEQLLDSWLLTSQMWLVPTLLAVYLCFILWLGPRLMAAHPPYTLNRFLLLYNTFQVLSNGYLVMSFITHVSGVKYLVNHACHPLPADQNPLRIEFLWGSYMYLCTKVVDLLDTVILVLRKKYSQITFLHVYHHTSTLFFVWLCVKYLQAEFSIPLGTMNAFVHMVMYFYYLLASLGPGFQKYLWWKKYLTTLQMSQFLVAISLMVYLTLNDCPVPQLYNAIWIFNCVVFLVFFSNFYIKTYVNKARQLKKLG